MNAFILTLILCVYLSLPQLNHCSNDTLSYVGPYLSRHHLSTYSYTSSQNSSSPQFKNSYYLINDSLSLLHNLKSTFFQILTYIHPFVNLLSSSASNSQTELEQRNLLSLVNISNRFNTDHIRDKVLNESGPYYTPEAGLATRKLMRSFRAEKLSRQKIFEKFYQSNYDIFCPCPPKLKNAHHNLEDPKYDSEDIECIYLPLSIVKYHCNDNATSNQNSQIVINRLICDLNLETNRLDWIINSDDTLFSLDERLDKADQQIEIKEIRSQSIHLSDFDIEFLHCELNKKTEFKKTQKSANGFNLLADRTYSAKNIGQMDQLTRSKRSYSFERNVEILLVIDILMNKYHGENLENYIFTIMSSVSSIFKDSSIGNNINIAIVQLILLNEKETKQLITNSASNTLERFCKWQSKLNLNRTDDHPLHHDMAILLTRTDLCRSNENCDTLGLAHSSKICNTKLSCAIVEDNGISTALTISHELGHNLGIPHDQDDKCRQLFKKVSDNENSQYNIMAKMLNFDSYPWKWSECSAHFITDFFDSGKGDCLLDKPKRNFLDVINMNGVSEAEISRNYESLLQTKSNSDKRLLNIIKNNRIDRERRDQRSNLHKRHNSILYELAFRKKNLMAGQYFNTDLQCQLIFGPGSTICPYMTTCKRLWCTVGTNHQTSPKLENDISNADHNHIPFKRRQETTATYNVADTGCRTQHIPWAEGTPCDHVNTSYEEHWCIRGECVSKQSYLENNLIVNGGWTDWFDWTNCTRSCGGGIQSSSRSCSNPEPKNGGLYCLGERKRYRSCNVDKCSNNMLDFREEQCSYFNGKELRDLPRHVIWRAHYAGVSEDDACKLYCRAEQTDGHYLLKEKVIDGTNCLETKKCINGRCVESGCDNVIHSNKTLDACGICGGENSTCTMIEGSFKETEVKYGYNFVVQIPTNAINIVIKQLDGTVDDDNSLALRSFNGTYLINGDAVISTYERVVWYEDVKIMYSGTGVSKNEMGESSIEEEMLRLSSNEQRLREEYNSQLNKLKHNKVAYSTEYINRLHKHRHQIKEYREQLKNLVKQSTKRTRERESEEARQFMETIVIKQPLKKPLIVEVLSVGRLKIPAISYRYSISKSNELIGKLTENRKATYFTYNNSLNGDEKANDRTATGITTNQRINFKKATKRRNLDNKMIIIDKINQVDSTKLSRKGYNIAIGTDLQVNKGTKHVKIRCSSKFISKWFKDGNEIVLSRNSNYHSDQNPTKFNESSDNRFEISQFDKSLKEFTNIKKVEQARYHLDKRGALVIRNVKKIDQGIYTCSSQSGHSRLVVA